MNMRICGSFKSAKNNLVRKSQTRKMPHLRKVSKFAFCGTYLRTAHLWKPDKKFLPQINQFLPNTVRPEISRETFPSKFTKKKVSFSARKNLIATKY